jgi:hypothetical protein
MLGIRRSRAEKAAALCDYEMYLILDYSVEL